MLLNELRAGTRPHHEALEAEMDLLNREWTVESYRKLIAGFYGFLAVTEPKFLASQDWARWGYVVESRRKLPLLVQDLRALDVDIPSLPSASSIPVIETFGQALGYLYVIEGSTLGGQLISQFFRERLGITPQTGGAYFAGYGKETGPRWKETLNVLATAPDTHSELPADRERTVQDAVNTASATFVCLSAWLVPLLAAAPIKC